jgi:O-antigen biosynthesis protein
VKACFLINDLQLSGGVGVVLEHAHQLSKRHGVEVTLALTEDTANPWSYRLLDGLKIVSLEEAASRRYDVAIATWWETAYHLFEVEAQRYAYFVQNLEDRFYRPGEVERLQAAVTHDLPVAFISEARWIVDALAEMRPDAPAFYVRNGIAKDVFPPRDRIEPSTTAPLRVLVEGHPDVWFKAVDDALEALERTAARHTATLVTPGGRPDDPGASRCVGPLTQHELAEVYAQSDIILKLSRVEGMFGPPLEAFHMGATCVVTPVTGQDEYVRHGWNGWVTDWDDAGGVARALELLDRDRRRLHFLRSNALLTARAWPSWDQAGQFMAAALQSIQRLPPPAGTYVSAKMMGDVRAAAEDLRLELTLRAMERDEAEGRLSRKTRELDLVLESRAYRFGTGLRSVWKSRVIRVVSYPARRVYHFLRGIGRRS